MQLGQALSIRPDILSPAAMNELQKLCDKVPSFNNSEAMQVIRDELGAPWHEVCPSPSTCGTSGVVCIPDIATVHGAGILCGNARVRASMFACLCIERDM